jgi:Cu-Zn family superoxide dismutase
MNNGLRRGCAVAAAGGLLLLAVFAPPPSWAQSATAELRNAQGESIGTATLKGDSGNVKIALKVSKLPPGTHGFHIHAVGECKAPDFASAGGHFNPTAKKHGLKNPEGSHAGDLPNLVVGSDGSATVEVVARGVTLGAPVDSHSLFPPTGTALVIHANPDDEKSDPAGNAGARIACGVITK